MNSTIRTNLSPGNTLKMLEVAAGAAGEGAGGDPVPDQVCAGSVFLR